MESFDNTWLNPIIELPLPMGVLVLAGILVACFTSVRGAILALLLTVPLQRFIVIPGVLGNRFTPHEAAFLCCMAAVLVRWKSQVTLRPPWAGPLGVPLLLMVVVGVASLLGNPFADFGISELIILVYLQVLMRLVADLASTHELALSAFRCWYMTCAAFAALVMVGGVLQFMGVDTFLMAGPRMIGTFFNPNQAGSFVVTGVFVFLAYASRPNTKLFPRIGNLILVFFSLVGAYFMQSRATVLAASAGLAVFFMLRRSRLSAIAALAILLLAGSAALSIFQKSDETSATQYDSRYSEGVDPDSQSAQARIENWNMGLEAFTRSPAIGIGIGTLWLQAPPTRTESYQVHNTYLSFLAETGAIGFLLLMAVVALIVKECVVAIRLARGTVYEDALIALIPALAALSVFNIFHYGIRARHLWVTIALVSAFRRLAAEKAHERRPGIAVAAPIPAFSGRSQQ